MIKATFYKEWIKSSNVIKLLLLITLALICYGFISVIQMFNSTAAHEVWALVVHKDMIMIPSLLKWVLLGSGIVIAFVQYSSEMVNKRLKLTLHLPCSEVKIIVSMYLFGMVVLFSIFLLSYVAYTVIFSFYFPREIVVAHLLSISPYVVASIVGYFLTAAVIVEPIWKRRVIAAFTAMGALSMFLVGGHSSAMVYNYSFMALLVVLSVLSSNYSITRFKDGAQN